MLSYNYKCFSQFVAVYTACVLFSDRLTRVVIHRKVILVRLLPACLIHGNIFVHCRSRHSLSGCLLWMGLWLNPTKSLLFSHKCQSGAEHLCACNCMGEQKLHIASCNNCFQLYSWCEILYPVFDELNSTSACCNTWIYHSAKNQWWNWSLGFPKQIAAHFDFNCL